jgi:hypothetical protein
MCYWKPKSLLYTNNCSLFKQHHHSVLSHNFPVFFSLRTPARNAIAIASHHLNVKPTPTPHYHPHFPRDHTTTTCWPPRHPRADAFTNTRGMHCSEDSSATTGSHCRPSKTTPSNSHSSSTPTVRINTYAYAPRAHQYPNTHPS